MRQAFLADVNTLRDIDIKSYEYPAEGDVWRLYLTSPEVGVLLAYEDDVPVGFVVYTEDEILKLAVKPDYRRNGIGTALIRRAADYAREAGSVSIQITVPEINCYPGHPEDVSLFLKDNEFKVVKTDPTCFFMYGQWVEGYVFANEDWLKT